MAEAILKFSFSVVGETRAAVLDKIDASVRMVMEQVNGEPWLVVTDDIKKLPLTRANMEDPSNYVYVANQEVFFAGPTVLGKDSAAFRDGFRPQDEPTDPFGL